jgi:hypothetical protein
MTARKKRKYCSSHDKISPGLNNPWRPRDCHLRFAKKRFVGTKDSDTVVCIRLYAPVYIDLTAKNSGDKFSSELIKPNMSGPSQI